MKSTKTRSNITATGSGNAFSHTLEQVPAPHAQAIVSVGGTFSGATIVVEGKQPAGDIWIPLALVNLSTRVKSSGSFSPADNASTASGTAVIADTRGFGTLRVYASAGTITGMTVEVTSGTSDDFGGDIGIQFSTTVGTIASGLTFSGGSGSNTVSIPDNLASAWDLTEGANSYLKAVTTDGSEHLAFGKSFWMPSAGLIGDAGGNELLKFPATVASAVNEFTVTNAATGVAPSFKASGGDTNVTAEFAGKGTGVVQLTSPLVDKRTVTALTDTATVTIAQLLTKVIEGAPTAAATYTLPTAANVVGGIVNAKVGDSFDFHIDNQSAGANTITVAAGSGGTATGTLTVAQNVVRSFKLVITNVTAASEAYNLYGIG